MASFAGAARDGRGKFREAAPHNHTHTRNTTASTIPLPTLRATAVTTTTTAPPVQLFTSIQSRPLIANPTHPLLWNSGGSNSTSNTAGSGQGGVGTPLHRTGSITSSASSPHTSVRASVENQNMNGARRGSDGGSTPRHTGTTARSLEPHRPDKSRSATVLLCAPQQEGGASSSSSSPPSAPAVSASRKDPAKRATAVNYNALFQQAQNAPPRETVSVSLSPEPSTSLAAAAPGASSTALPHQLHPETVQGSAQQQQQQPSPSHTLAPLGAVEGPLPPEVRRLIAQSTSESSGGNAAVDAVTQEAAEQQARRLISTGRRVKVYREELAAAEEERRDWAAAAEQRSLVRSVLVNEVDDINARIQALLQERALCEEQLREEDAAASREARQLSDAEARVAVLRTTIDDIVEETVVPRLMLQQLVPSLLIENYI